MGSQKSDTTEVGKGGWLSNLVIFFSPNISQIHLLFTTLTLATLVQNLITSTKIMPVLLCAGRASPSPAQLLAFAPGKEQAAGVWEP